MQKACIHPRLRPKLGNFALLTLLIGAGGLLHSAADIDVPLNLDDIKGVSSKIALAHAHQLAETSRRHDEQKNGAARRAHEEAIAQARRDRRTQLASAQWGQRTFTGKSVVTSPGKNSRGKGAAKPVEQATEIIKTPYQDTTLALVDPRQQAVPGVRVIATVHRKSPRRPQDVEDVVIGDRPGSALITDKDGRVKLRKIGPLPVSIDIAFAEEGEWRHVNAQTASLFIPSNGIGPSREFNGRAVAVYSAAPTAAPALRQVRALSRLDACAPPAMPKVVVRREYKDVVYTNYTPTPVPVEHTAVDVQVTTLPGSNLTSPAAPGQTWTADAAGLAVCKVPVSALGSGPIPIRVAKDLPGGEAEAVIPAYKTDPYDRDNTVKCDALQLVRLKSVELPGNVSVLDRAGRVENAIGGQKQETGNASGGMIWRYPQGITALMRRTPNPNAEMLCEELVLQSAEAGKIGGIQVGSTQEQVHEALGTPTFHVTQANGYTQESYLNSGLLVFSKENHVGYVIIARPTVLLKDGTTAFVRRPKARLFIEGFTGHDHTGLVSKDDLRGYLAQVHSLQLVDSRENADLTLSASARFTETKDKLAGSLPFRYECGVDVDYTLRDVEKNQVVGGSRAHANALADYEAEVEDDGPLMQALLDHQDARKILESVDKTASEEEQAKVRKMSRDERARYRVQHLLDLQNSMTNAARRCPIIASRKAFGDMVGDITRNADFNVRVTHIDQAQGLLTLNVGTADGVQVSTEQIPSQFEISVEGQPLPYHEQGLSADYYTAVVTEAQEHSCTCQLRHRWRTVEQGAESEQEAVATEAAQCIPQANTGIVSARAWLPNPRLDANLIVPEDPQYGNFIQAIFGPQPESHRDYKGFQQVFNHYILLPGYGRDRYVSRSIFVAPSARRISLIQPVQHRGNPTSPLPIGLIDTLRRTHPSGPVILPTGTTRNAVVRKYVDMHPNTRLGRSAAGIPPPFTGRGNTLKKNGGGDPIGRIGRGNTGSGDPIGHVGSGDAIGRNGGSSSPTAAGGHPPRGSGGTGNTGGTPAPPPPRNPNPPKPVEKPKEEKPKEEKKSDDKKPDPPKKGKG